MTIQGLARQQERRHGSIGLAPLLGDAWRRSQIVLLCCAGCAATHVNFSADGNMQLVAGMTRHLHDV